MNRAEYDAKAKEIADRAAAREKELKDELEKRFPFAQANEIICGSRFHLLFSEVPPMIAIMGMDFVENVMRASGIAMNVMARINCGVMHAGELTEEEQNKLGEYTKANHKEAIALAEAVDKILEEATDELDKLGPEPDEEGVAAMEAPSKLSAEEIRTIES